MQIPTPLLLEQTPPQSSALLSWKQPVLKFCLISLGTELPGSLTPVPCDVSPSCSTQFWCGGRDAAHPPSKHRWHPQLEPRQPPSGTGCLLIPRSPHCITSFPTYVPFRQQLNRAHSPSAAELPPCPRDLGRVPAQTVPEQPARLPGHRELLQPSLHTEV